MTRQTLKRSTALLWLPAIILSGCNTLDFKDAEPEKYIGLDCEQLDLLAESYRDATQDEIFADVSDLERRNEGSRDFGTNNRSRPYEIEDARNRRSIALARRQKGC